MKYESKKFSAIAVVLSAWFGRHLRLPSIYRQKRVLKLADVSNTRETNSKKEYVA